MKYLLFAAAMFALPCLARAEDVQILPNPDVTPGVVATSDKDVLCDRGPDGLTYSKEHRHTPLEWKREIRMRDHAYGDGEVDHRVPLCLGGADAKENLWWQPGRNHGTEWVFQVKDKLEAHACQQVCHGKVTPAEAQQWFTAPDWRDAYCREIGGPPCKNGLNK
jgi:hypothetical protein